MGFEALRLSIWGLWNIFRDAADYVVCYHSIPLGAAQRLTGEIPNGIQWIPSYGKVPEFLMNHFDTGTLEGVGWKFSPLRVFENQFELALDNDCILWELPPALRRWLASGNRNACVIAEDVRA